MNKKINAVVTGGSSGLGEATVRKILESGGNVSILDMQEDKAKVLSEEFGEACTFFYTDVTNEESINKALTSAISKYQFINLLVNCAGIGSASKTVGKDGAPPLDYFKIVLDVNLVGTFNVLRLAAVEMGKNEPEKDNECGVIINTASVAAYDGQIGQAAYSASKAGVVGMTLPIARDLGRMGIRINTIAPGIFDTPMMAMAPDEVRRPLIDMTQFPKRLGNPEEYALLAMQIIENPYLNGETIRLDGGIRMQPK